ncbi:MAG: heavy metal translocating P-type ATPase [Spirochaetia bacterium]|nr:heavy metal translocating P-type ATPase [Spirochaetia bacterium]
MNTEHKEITLDLFGMTCANCAMRIERGLSTAPGVEEARVNFATETAFVRFGDGVNPQDLLTRVESLGYKASEKTADRRASDARHTQDAVNLRNRFLVSALLSLPLLYTMVAHFKLTSFLPMPQWIMNPWVQLAFATPVQFWIGFPFYRGSFRALKNGAANMDVLVALGTSAAYGYSLFAVIVGNTSSLYFETSAVLITFLLGGKWMEILARGRSSEAIRALLSLVPDTARIKRDSQWIEIPAEFVKSGDILLVHPGEKIPTDATVTEGSSAIDESMLTGESLPVEKVAQSKVFGGTLNGNGALQLKATMVGSKTVLASIIRIVEDAQASRAPLQKIADRISGIFVPTVIGIAAITFLVWYFLDGNVAHAIENGIAVLVIACPCALGLATPVSLLVGTGRAAGMGILFRNAEALEKAATLDRIAFDKTGTLTTGKPAVKEIHTSGDNGDRLLGLLASAENSSEHPLARAIVQEAKRRGTDLVSAREVQSEPGGGIRARVSESIVMAGRLSFIVTSGLKPPAELVQIAERLEDQGQSVVWGVALEENESWIVLGLADEIRSTSREAMGRLAQLGLEPVLLTGDNATVARQVAEATGIKSVFASLSPAEKSEKVSAMIKDGFRVGMTGDGINDAPALARSTVGFAMGQGTDIAIQTADVVLVKGDLNRLCDAIGLSRATVRNIRQNLFWALMYNALGIPVAAAGLLAPWIAGAAMALSSVSVVANALRLKRMRI